MKFALNVAAVFLVNLIAGISIASENHSYQCAFVTDPKSYDSLAFNVENIDLMPAGEKQNILEKAYQFESAKVSMKVQQIGFDQVSLVISQVVTIGDAPVTFMSATSAAAGTKTISLQASNVSESGKWISLSCVLR